MASLSDEVKLVLSGDSGTGKTSILQMFADSEFNELYTSTIGVDSRREVLQIEEQRVVVQIWDTSGHRRFMSDISTCYSTANCIMLVYITSDRDSFCDIAQWKQEIEKHARPDIPLILVGNKCDLEERRVVSKGEGERMAASIRAAFLEVNAKTSESIKEAFTTAVKLAMNPIFPPKCRSPTLKKTQQVGNESKEAVVTVKGSSKCGGKKAKNLSHITLYDHGCMTMLIIWLCPNVPISRTVLSACRAAFPSRFQTPSGLPLSQYDNPHFNCHCLEAYVIFLLQLSMRLPP